MMIPTIDPKVRYVGSSYLRGMNAEQLRQLESAVVVQDSGDNPLVVIVPYETYLKLQEAGAKTKTTTTRRVVEEELYILPQGAKNDGDNIAQLDAVGPELSSGRGKASTETFRRGPRQKGDKTR